IQAPPVPGLTCGNLSGNITAEVTGGYADYDYLWSNSSTTASQTGLATGIYTLTVFDEVGDSATAEFVVGYVTIWDTLIDMTIDQSGGLVTGEPQQGAYGSYAIARNTLLPGYEGWVEFTIAQGDTFRGALGFTAAANQDTASHWVLMV